MSFRIRGPWITVPPVSNCLSQEETDRMHLDTGRRHIEMVGSCICCGIQPKMITPAAWHHASSLRISREGVVGLSNAHRGDPALGSSLVAIELQLGRRISSHGVMGCSNFPPGGVPQVQGRALGLGSSLVAIELQLGRRIASHGVKGCSNFPPGGVPQVQGRALGLGSSIAANRKASLALRRVKAGNKLENDREEAVTTSQKEARGEKKSVDKKEGGLVESIEAELGRQFGGVLWFSVLLLCLALFGGAYAFLIFNYADFSDIPILRGPQR